MIPTSRHFTKRNGTDLTNHSSDARPIPANLKHTAGVTTAPASSNTASASGSAAPVSATASNAVVKNEVNPKLLQYFLNTLTHLLIYTSGTLTAVAGKNVGFAVKMANVEHSKPELYSSMEHLVSSKTAMQNQHHLENVFRYFNLPLIAKTTKPSDGHSVLYICCKDPTMHSRGGVSTTDYSKIIELIKNKLKEHGCEPKPNLDEKNDKYRPLDLMDLRKFTPYIHHILDPILDPKILTERFPLLNKRSADNMKSLCKGLLKDVPRAAKKPTDDIFQIRKVEGGYKLYIKKLDYDPFIDCLEGSIQIPTPKNDEKQNSATTNRRKKLDNGVTPPAAAGQFEVYEVNEHDSSDIYTEDDDEDDRAFAKSASKPVSAPAHSGSAVAVVVDPAHMPKTLSRNDPLPALEKADRPLSDNATLSPSVSIEDFFNANRISIHGKTYPIIKHKLKTVNESTLAELATSLKTQMHSRYPQLKDQIETLFNTIKIRNNDELFSKHEKLSQEYGSVYIYVESYEKVMAFRTLAAVNSSISPNGVASASSSGSIAPTVSNAFKPQPKGPKIPATHDEKSKSQADEKSKSQTGEKSKSQAGQKRKAAKNASIESPKKVLEKALKKIGKTKHGQSYILRLHTIPRNPEKRSEAKSMAESRLKKIIDALEKMTNNKTAVKEFRKTYLKNGIGQHYENFAVAIKSTAHANFTAFIKKASEMEENSGAVVEVDTDQKHAEEPTPKKQKTATAASASSAGATISTPQSSRGRSKPQGSSTTVSPVVPQRTVVPEVVQPPVVPMVVVAPAAQPPVVALPANDVAMAALVPAPAAVPPRALVPPAAQPFVVPPVAQPPVVPAPANDVAMAALVPAPAAVPPRALVPLAANNSATMQTVPAAGLAALDTRPALSIEIRGGKMTLYNPPSAYTDQFFALFNSFSAEVQARSGNTGLAGIANTSATQSNGMNNPLDAKPR